MNLEFSDPAGDAPCPRCGHLLWLSAELLTQLQRQLADSFGVPSEEITTATAMRSEERDSLEMVELVMEMEEEFDVSIPNDFAQRIQTVGDAVRYIEQQRRGEGR